MDDHRARCVILNSVVLLVTAVYVDAAVNERTSYCKRETFEADCDVNHVVIMTYARFGRMQLGRCATSKFGDLGCSKDVLDILDSECSGKRQCSIRASDHRLLQTQPCSEDFAEYLEVNYTCKAVHVSRDDNCHSTSSPTMVLRDKQGAIASQYATDQCAYTIEAPVGQRINFTVTDFSQARLNMSSSTSHLPSSTSHLYSRGTHICQQLFVVTDDGYDVTTVCRDGARRRHVYESRSHVVTLQLKGIHTAFLVEYKIVGCPPLKTPASAHATVTGDTITLRCRHSTDVFMLVCNDGDWSGSIDKCPTTVKSKVQRGADDVSIPSLGISLIIVFGVAAVIVIYVAVMIVCVMFIKRRRKTKVRSGMLRPQHLDGRDADAVSYDKIHASPHEEQLPMLLQQSRALDAASRDFEDTVTCQLHGTTFTTRECAYGVLPCSNMGADIIECPYAALPRCCQCNACIAHGRTTLHGCNITTHEQAIRSEDDAEAKLYESGQSKLYESGQSLKAVRFATINDKRNATSKRRPSQNLQLKHNVVTHLNQSATTAENSPDIVPAPADNETNELREKQISTFKSL